MGGKKTENTQSFAVNIRKIKLRRIEVRGNTKKNIRSVRGWGWISTKFRSQQQQRFKKTGLHHNDFPPMYTGSKRYNRLLCWETTQGGGKDRRRLCHQGIQTRGGTHSHACGTRRRQMVPCRTVGIVVANRVAVACVRQFHAA